MSTDTLSNKQILQAVFAELAKGNGQPFLDAMADDFCWIMPGSNAWCGTYRGKQAVRQQLFRPLFAQFATPYNNTYCYVCRLAGGQLRELVEYMDTQLVETALEPPVR